jgi:kynurenine formamidase
MFKTGVLLQKITTAMNCTTRGDSLAHVIEVKEYIHKILLHIFTMVK